MKPEVKTWLFDILQSIEEIEMYFHGKPIVDARNRIIHGYDTLTVEVIWGIVINHLPMLKNEVAELLSE